MTPDEVKEFRGSIEKQREAKSGEFEKIIGVGALGALAFFLTINEKFFGLVEAKYKWLMWVSGLSLIATLILLGVIFILTTNYDIKFLNKIDNYYPDETPPEADKYIFKLWKKSSTVLTRIRNCAIVLLLMGIICETSFLINNLEKKNKEELVPLIRIYQQPFLIQRCPHNTKLCKECEKETFLLKDSIVVSKRK